MLIFRRTNLIILVRAVRPDDMNICSSGVLKVDFAGKIILLELFLLKQVLAQ